MILAQKKDVALVGKTWEWETRKKRDA